VRLRQPRQRAQSTHLATLTRDTITVGGQPVGKLAAPTPTQRRAFDLIGASIPLTLT
jgi:hypothetical protein